MSHRIVTEPYTALLNQVNGMMDKTVQDAFRCTNNCQLVVESTDDNAEVPSQTPQTLTSQDVSTVLEAHESGGFSQTRATDPVVLQLSDIDQSALMPKSELASLQGQDGVLGRLFYYVQRHRRPTRRERASESPGVLNLLRHWPKLVIKDGVMYRVKKDKQMNMTTQQFIVPDSLKPKVLQGVHDSAGHQGHTSEPMELVCIDFWTAELSDRRCVDVLVVTDHFSKMAHAFPCKNQSAKQVARRLWDDFFCIYGFPKRIHSDQGANFESLLIKELLDMAGIQKSHTTPYHPMGNGIVERYNRTLGNMIRALPPQSKSRWPQMLRMLTFCYNCTEHETTGFAPFFLMFGRIPRLPIDVVFQHALSNSPVVDHHEFVSRLKHDLSVAARIAQQNSSSEQAHQAMYYNRKAKGSPLDVGDRVLVANRGERGKRKIADKWESTVYEVVSVKPDINVYCIKDPVTSRTKVLHRNLLLPVNFLTAAAVSAVADHSPCPSTAGSGLSDPIVPDEVQDNETKTVNWLLQMEDNSCMDEVVNHPDCASDIPVRGSSVDIVCPTSSDVTKDLPEPDLPGSVALSDSPEPVSNLTTAAVLSEPIQHDLSAEHSTDTKLDLPATDVVCTQPSLLCTRSGRPVKPPARLICEMNEQVVDDSMSTVDSLFSFVRTMFAG
ncbi:uncharacterized protein LOC114145478 [Xiphophorus couchianus]|uniref:uncharacterized protein LOC114145478 n=1 Tax=Xiphophorus couchianus TaxID=32473 RepID=UPI0010162746|nr:uncharacterized protein LOC114145478 [Xiphophorus couchianus]